MKKIHLLRHAKSDWGDDALADIDRPLNARGIRTAQMMASHLLNAGCSFAHVFCSPAVRAQSTIELIHKSLPGLRVQWQIDHALYTFNSNALHAWFKSLNESITDCLIIGHNPALTTFCNQLSNSSIPNIPTCGYAQLKAQQENPWQALSETPFELTTLLKPKELI